MKKTTIKAIALCLVLALCAGCTEKSANSLSASSAPASVDVTVTSTDTASGESSSAGSSVSETTEDVTATVFDGYTFSLTGDISDIINNLNQNDIKVIDAQYFRLYETDSAGKINYGRTKYEPGSDSDAVLLTPDPVPNVVTATMGYIRYIFDSNRFPCKSISLLNDWSGDIEALDSYLAGDTGIREDDYIFAVFKNGKLLPVSDISEKYADKAAKVVESGSFEEYLKAEGLSYYKNDEINLVPGSFTAIDANPAKSGSAEFYALYFALFDLAAEYQAGDIDNFGLIFKDARGYLNISVACSLDNFTKLKTAERYKEQ